jgi:hypothetical protein
VEAAKTDPQQPGKPTPAQSESASVALLKQAFQQQKIVIVRKPAVDAAQLEQKTVQSQQQQQQLQQQQELQQKLFKEKQRGDNVMNDFFFVNDCKNKLACLLLESTSKVAISFV